MLLEMGSDKRNCESGLGFFESAGAACSQVDIMLQLLKRCNDNARRLKMAWKLLLNNTKATMRMLKPDGFEISSVIGLKCGVEMGPKCWSIVSVNVFRLM